MNQKLIAKIRQQAYQLWENEGRQDGDDFATWLRAEAIVLSALSREESGIPTTTKNRSASTKSVKKSATKSSKKKVTTKKVVKKKADRKSVV